MDKFKEILGVVRRQHFWIVAPILFIVGFFGWMQASSKLAKEFAANQTTVKNYITTMNGVSGGGAHPNQEYVDGMGQLIAARRDNVRKAWQKKWERQKQLLKWPESLGKEFLDQVDSMRPIERVEATRSINGTFRRAYARYIKEELPRLATVMGAKWTVSQIGGTTASFGGERRRSEGISAGDATDDSLVLWNTENETAIASRYAWDEIPPTTHQMLYAQEDLWILNDLAQIIKRTNGEAVARSQAAIKEIHFIQIGADVTPPSRQPFDVIRPAEVGAAPADPASAEATPPPDTARESAPAEPAAGQAVDAEGRPLQRDPIADLVKNRYFNEKYEPIADLETLKNSGSVAKRVPVRMLLMMDQRQINKLLVEAANAELTLEVIQLRLNPTDTSNGLNMLASRQSEGRGGLMGNQPRTLKDYHSFDRLVELLGIIYIFNPVNDELLGSAPAATETPAPAAPAEEDKSANVIRLWQPART